MNLDRTFQEHVGKEAVPLMVDMKQRERERQEKNPRRFFVVYFLQLCPTL